MALDEKIKDGKVQYDVNRAVKKYQYYHEVKLINMNI